jgi:hypothetical protein
MALTLAERRSFAFGAMALTLAVPRFGRLLRWRFADAGVVAFRSFAFGAMALTLAVPRCGRLLRWRFADAGVVAFRSFAFGGMALSPAAPRWGRLLRWRFAAAGVVAFRSFAFGAMALTPAAPRCGRLLRWRFADAGVVAFRSFAFGATWGSVPPDPQDPRRPLRRRGAGGEPGGRCPPGSPHPSNPPGMKREQREGAAIVDATRGQPPEACDPLSPAGMVALTKTTIRRLGRVPVFALPLGPGVVRGTWPDVP